MNDRANITGAELSRPPWTDIVYSAPLFRPITCGVVSLSVGVKGGRDARTRASAVKPVIDSPGERDESRAIGWIHTIIPGSLTVRVLSGSGTRGPGLSVSQGPLAQAVLSRLLLILYSTWRPGPDIPSCVAPVNVCTSWAPMCTLVDSDVLQVDIQPN